MEIVKATEEHQEKFASEIPELVWATGPVSYEYHFGDRALFDTIVLSSWSKPGTLFAADATTLAIEDGKLMGIEIGMTGSEFRQRQAALGPVWQELIANSQVDPEDIPGVLERSGHASWLNPVVHSDTYQIHGLRKAQICPGKYRTGSGTPHPVRVRDAGRTRLVRNAPRLWPGQPRRRPGRACGG